MCGLRVSLTKAVRAVPDMAAHIPCEPGIEEYVLSVKSDFIVRDCGFVDDMSSSSDVVYPAPR
jgi:hypothetical protein